MYALHQLEYICGGLLLKTGPRKMVLAQPISMGKDINIPQNDGREILQFMNIWQKAYWLREARATV